MVVHVRATPERRGGLPLRAAAAQAQPPYPGIGRAATPAEVAAWDIDVRPDFKGLPAGSGSVARGMQGDGSQSSSIGDRTDRDLPASFVLGGIAVVVLVAGLVGFKTTQTVKPEAER